MSNSTEIRDHFPPGIPYPKQRSSICKAGLVFAYKARK
jgi:hypothetical protein